MTPPCERSARAEWTLPIGKSKIEREGTNITLCAHSRSVGFCLQAAKELEAAGISAEVGPSSLGPCLAAFFLGPTPPLLWGRGADRSGLRVATLQGLGFPE